MPTNFKAIRLSADVGTVFLAVIHVKSKFYICNLNYNPSKKHPSFNIERDLRHARQNRILEESLCCIVLAKKRAKENLNIRCI